MKGDDMVGNLIKFPGTYKGAPTDQSELVAKADTLAEELFENIKPANLEEEYDTFIKNCTGNKGQACHINGTIQCVGLNACDFTLFAFPNMGEPLTIEVTQPAVKINRVELLTTYSKADGSFDVERYLKEFFYKNYMTDGGLDAHKYLNDFFRPTRVMENLDEAIAQGERNELTVITILEMPCAKANAPALPCGSACYGLEHTCPIPR